MSSAKMPGKVNISSKKFFEGSQADRSPRINMYIRGCFNHCGDLFGFDRNLDLECVGVTGVTEVTNGSKLFQFFS